jgi:hypothetical protein
MGNTKNKEANYIKIKQNNPENELLLITNHRGHSLHVYGSEDDLWFCLDEVILMISEQNDIPTDLNNMRVFLLLDDNKYKYTNLGENEVLKRSSPTEINYYEHINEIGLFALFNNFNETVDTSLRIWFSMLLNTRIPTSIKDQKIVFN